MLEKQPMKALLLWWFIFASAILQAEGICSKGFRSQCDPSGHIYFCRTLDVEMPQFALPYQNRLLGGSIGFCYPLNKNSFYSCPSFSHFSRNDAGYGFCVWDVTFNNRMHNILADFSLFQVGSFGYRFSLRDSASCNEAEEVLYNLEVDYEWANPDGVYRQVIGIKNLANHEFQLPGPELRVQAFQNISVTITNRLPTEAITIHWHGMPQQGTNYMDGVPYITQLPILPGRSFRYRFNATRWGTHWYHSHSGAQYGDGLFGALIVENPRDPHKHKYHEDVVVVLTEWFWRSSPEIIAELKADVHEPEYFPIYESVLINGKARADCNDPKVPKAVPIKSNKKQESWECQRQDYTRFDVQQGKKYRLRIIGANSGSSFIFSIDNHKMAVIAVDGVDVERSKEVNSVVIFVAQRYDVIVKANQPVGCYWMRAATLSSSKEAREESKAMFCYNQATETSSSKRFKKLLPIDDLQLRVHPNDPTYLKELSFNQLIRYDLDVWCSNTEYKCTIGVNDNTPIPFHLPSSPVLHDLVLGRKPHFPQPMITLDKNKWILIVLRNNGNMSHPFHLHGHHFYYLGKGVKRQQFNQAQLRLTKPVVRDTVQIEEESWLAFAFFTDNPGLWFFHCHIEWHLEAGLALLFYERDDTNSNLLWQQLPDDMEVLQTVREAKKQTKIHYKQKYEEI